MFYFKFAEETKYFKNVATNIVQFDKGPQLISHPPPSMSLGDDLELGVSWTCEAVANGPVMYSWLRDKKVLKCYMTKFSEILFRCFSIRFFLRMIENASSCLNVCFHVNTLSNPKSV